MIEKYMVRKVSHEEVLFLYLNYNYEFASISHSKKKKGIIGNIKDYILKNKIIFNGTKIVLIVGGYILATIFINNSVQNYAKVDNNYTYVDKVILNNYVKDKIDSKTEIIIKDEKPVIKEEVSSSKTTKDNTATSKKSETSNKSSTNSNQNQTPSTSSTNPPKVETPPKVEEPPKTEVVENKTMVTVYRSSDSILNIELEEYLIGVVAAEMPASFNTQALKAQAVVARSYTLRFIKQNKKLTDTSQTQEYKDNNQLKNMWGGSYNTYYNKIKSAVNDTKGLYMTYNGEIIDAVYHSTSNGYTEDAVNVWGYSIPYLKSVSSPYDLTASSYLRTINKDFNELTNILGITIDENTEFAILSKNSSNRISSIQIGTNTYTGIDIRNLFGLRSADFDIEVTSGGVNFTTRGYGHGVGMSQYGANGMANNGSSYEGILKHYYQGISIKSL